MRSWWPTLKYKRAIPSSTGPGALFSRRGAGLRSSRLPKREPRSPLSRSRPKRPPRSSRLSKREPRSPRSRSRPKRPPRSPPSRSRPPRLSPRSPRSERRSSQARLASAYSFFSTPSNCCVMAATICSVEKPVWCSCSSTSSYRLSLFLSFWRMASAIVSTKRALRTPTMSS